MFAIELTNMTNMKNTSNFETDLCLNHPFTREELPISNCWHFYSRGEDVDMMFYSADDFEAGMNRIYKIRLKHDVVILAFVLMDTHFHFLLYGGFDECNRFAHEFIRLTSQYIASKYKEHKKLLNVSINHQTVSTDTYLKTVICYIIKNPVVAGMPYQFHNYPWSSGSLYFTGDNDWSCPYWKVVSADLKRLTEFTTREIKDLLESNEYHTGSVRMLGRIVFPGEYVDYKVVEKIFKTYRAFNYFISQNKETDVESQGGAISLLSIPMQEMRQNRDTLRKELFGTVDGRTLNTQQRIRLAKALRRKYNSSPKQIARLCGLDYKEVQQFLD